MKVLLVNGSPHPHGTTARQLGFVEEGLAEGGVGATWFQLSAKPVRGCIACERCAELQRCAFDDDQANSLLDALNEADGVVVGSPVYYGGPNAALCALLDRAFYAGAEHGPGFAGKPAAAVVSCWRAGTTAALDRLYKYFSITQMPIVTSYYWSQMFDGRYMGHEDDYGADAMRQLGRNLAEQVRRGSR
ncbi:MAG: flavodoxin family protein [Olsenella sp.]|nr:flavodoxin family protein [Olsenella sp.]